jgi:hypothetical protein
VRARSKLDAGQKPRSGSKIRDRISSFLILRASPRDLCPSAFRFRPSLPPPTPSETSAPNAFSKSSAGCCTTGAARESGSNDGFLTHPACPADLHARRASRPGSPDDLHGGIFPCPGSPVRSHDRRASRLSTPDESRDGRARHRTTPDGSNARRLTHPTTPDDSHGGSRTRPSTPVAPHGGAATLPTTPDRSRERAASRK